ncbi:MAG TPA: hypothetical protein VEG39_20245 [Clostridia bacterium]|nr:hypothetical protein [Clostridia bacterium]
MKFLRGLLVFFLIIVIIGGLGYIGWNYYYMPYMGNTGNLPSATPPANTPADTNQGSMGNMQMPGQGNTGTTTMPGHGNMGTQTPAAQNTGYSALALQNKDRLTQVVATINQALDLITMDPYSRLTLPDGTNEAAAQQAPQGGGTVNIYPNGNNAVNVNPATPSAATTGTTPAAPSAATGMTADANFVYDQAKLEQLHRGIFKLAQGVMLLNQLNSNLTLQAGLMEANPPTYQSYIDRYNTTMLNKTKLNNAINMINEASDMVNVNPYASRNGYQYDVQAMDRLHRGIYKLAQGMVLASELDEEFAKQMVSAVTAAQYLYSTGSMSGMNMNMPMQTGLSSLFNSANLASILNLILVILIVTLILSIFGAISQMLKGKKRLKDNESHNDSSNI